MVEQPIKYYLDGTLLSDYGIIVSGSTGLIDMPKLKAVFKSNVPDRNGELVDLSALYYEPRDITLECWIVADDPTDFNEKMMAFKAAIMLPGLRRLIIEVDDQDKPLVYDVYLADGISVSKKWAISTMKATFQIKLREPDPIKKVWMFAVDDITNTVELDVDCTATVTIRWGDGSETNLYVDGLQTVEHEYPEHPFGDRYIVFTGNIDDLTIESETAIEVWGKLI